VVQAEPVVPVVLVEQALKVIKVLPELQAQLESALQELQAQLVKPVLLVVQVERVEQVGQGLLVVQVH